MSKSLQAYNTFGIKATAPEIVIVEEEEQLVELREKGFFNRKHVIIGGGSNILITNDLDYPVLLNRISGIEVLEEKEDSVLIEAGAGEIWHHLVMWTIEQDFGGLENLALIPGTVGAAPMQNIGAYGVEIKERFVSLTAFDKHTGHFRTFNREACEFGYRDSIFKQEGRNRYVICSVTLELTKNTHQLNTSYGAINAELERMGVSNPGIADIATAVIHIRSSKLPNPAEIGNSGSFFKNPIVENSLLERLQTEFPDIPNYPVDESHVKLAAGWLIEKAGWKGRRVGNCGTHVKQALVLVNYGGATGEEIWDLALTIQSDVRKTFGVELEPEVNLIA